MRSKDTLHERQVLLVMVFPDVYKLPNNDCYIVFGEAKVSHLSCPIGCPGTYNVS